MRIFYRPIYRVSVENTTIELWVTKRKLPFFMHADAIIAPVAPDLKMVSGIAKMIRDYGGDAAQYEANKAAPLPPGTAFLGTGGRYRFKYTLLAVIFDEFKRVTPQNFLLAIRNAMQQARRKGARSIIVPDMTENLLTQPTVITDEQRRETGATTARLTLDAIVASRGLMEVVKVWVWEPATADLFLQEMKKLETEGWEESRLLLPAGTDLAALEQPMTPSWIEQGESGKIRHTTLTPVLGDILRLEADAVLRPTSTTFGLEEMQAGGVAAAHGGDCGPARKPLEVRLLECAGQAVVEEARAIGSIPLGGASLTGAGALSNVGHIIHLGCRTPDAPAYADSLWDSVQSALILADGHGFKTLILPNLGAGKNDYAAEAAAPMALEAILNYMRHLARFGRESGIETIYLAADTPHEEVVWQRALLKYMPEPLAALLEAHD